MEEILFNRVKSFSINVPETFNIKTDLHILKESVEDSLKYLYNTLLDKFYLRTFTYKIDNYYPVSNIVIVILTNNIFDKNTFTVSLKKQM